MAQPRKPHGARRRQSGAIALDMLLSLSFWAIGLLFMAGLVAKGGQVVGRAGSLADQYSAVADAASSLPVTAGAGASAHPEALLEAAARTSPGAIAPGTLILDNGASRVQVTWEQGGSLPQLTLGRATP